MRLALTGGAIGIGAATVACLKADGHEVVIFDIQQPQSGDRCNFSCAFSLSLGFLWGGFGFWSLASRVWAFGVFLGLWVTGRGGFGCSAFWGSLGLGGFGRSGCSAFI